MMWMMRIRRSPLSPSSHHCPFSFTRFVLPVVILIADIARVTAVTSLFPVSPSSSSRHSHVPNRHCRFRKPWIRVVSRGGGETTAVIPFSRYEDVYDKEEESFSPQSPQSSSRKGNVIVQLATYVKTSLVKTKDGCTLLWTNYGRCNEIRKKIHAHRHSIQSLWEQQNLTAELSNNAAHNNDKERLKSLVGGISYEEFLFLQKGKEDRSKVFNLLFLMWGAPRFLPYALMFNPNLLPSPFREESSSSSSSIWAAQSRERSAAVIQALWQLERRAAHGGVKSPVLAKLNNVLGRGKHQAEKKRQQLAAVIHGVSDALTTALPYDDDHENASSSLLPAGASRVLASLQSCLYRNDADFSRAEKRLCTVPKPLVQSINTILNAAADGGGGSFLSGLQPHFMVRGRVLAHIQKIQDSDVFLLSNQVNLTRIPKRCLQEACSERLQCVYGLTSDELRRQLGDWLALVSPITTTATSSSSSSSSSLSLSSSSIAAASRYTTTTTTTTIPCTETTTGGASFYYNDNLARLALMGYYSCWATRNDHSALRLPAQLFRRPSSSSS